MKFGDFEITLISKVGLDNILNCTLRYECVYINTEGFIMDFREELLKTIQLMIDNSLSCYKSDRTYKSVIKRIDKKGYVILDRTGSERTVKCCIPNLEFRPGQSVWVKEPMGDLKGIHICGVV